MRPKRGEPLLLRDERLDSFAAFVTAAAASDIDELRGEGVSLRFGGMFAMARGCMGEEEVDLDGGRVFRSGGAIIIREAAEAWKNIRMIYSEDTRIGQAQGKTDE